MIEESLEKIKETVFKEKKIANEFGNMINSLGNADESEKKMINNQLDKLKFSLKRTNDDLLVSLEEIAIKKPLETKMEVKEPVKKESKMSINRESEREIRKEKISELDREILKRLKKKKEKIVVKKEKKPSQYIKIANNFFAGRVKNLLKQKKLESLEKDLIKSNLAYTPISYISILILTTIIAVIISILVFVFFLFFNLSPDLPIISMNTDLGTRFVEVIWVILIIPLVTFLFMYIYPSLEKKSLEGRINQELPFATIHMAAIAGSMIEPTNVFSIISSTKEYPNLEKEFNKLLNEINIYGYDLVTALKDTAANCASQKLAELFNGLATTITSGGDMFDFFDKRSQTLLFDYRLDREKQTKSAETFMDIYISVVIAAPMILMLLLMMMKISGLGVGLSTSTITLLVVGGVSIVNVFFLVFLQLKHQAPL